MAELRRLLIAPQRLQSAGSVLLLNQQERHYVRRVLRLRPGQDLAIVDGEGHLWTAQLLDGEQLTLQQPLAEPLQSVPSPTPMLGLAVVGVRRGMDDLMRMACELGIDRIQLLSSQWRTPQAEDRPDRWQTILDEAVEQCERLWRPQLLPTREVFDWWDQPGSLAIKGLATTRQDALAGLDRWLQETTHATGSLVPAEVWVAIGPEAGWTNDEKNEALRNGWVPIQLGRTILRTSTAAVAAATLLTNWRSALE